MRSFCAARYKSISQFHTLYSILIIVMSIITYAMYGVLFSPATSEAVLLYRKRRCPGISHESCGEQDSDKRNSLQFHSLRSSIQNSIRISHSSFRSLYPVNNFSLLDCSDVTPHIILKRNPQLPSWR